MSGSIEVIQDMLLVWARELTSLDSLSSSIFRGIPDDTRSNPGHSFQTCNPVRSTLPFPGRNEGHINRTGILSQSVCLEQRETCCKAVKVVE